MSVAEWGVWSSERGKGNGSVLSCPAPARAGAPVTVSAATGFLSALAVRSGSVRMPGWGGACASALARRGVGGET